jgi:hypothetical protein
MLRVDHSLLEVSYSEKQTRVKEVDEHTYQSPRSPLGIDAAGDMWYFSVCPRRVVHYTELVLPLDNSFWHRIVNR